jgi:hypothetical protein
VVTARAAREAYPFIVMWGERLGSYAPYIDGQCLQAVADGAPANATYRRRDGSWSTLDDIVSPETCAAFGIPVPTFRVWSTMSPPGARFRHPRSGELTEQAPRWVVLSGLAHDRAEGFVELLTNSGYEAELEREDDDE